jgi:hypothetical protein
MYVILYALSLSNSNIYLLEDVFYDGETHQGLLKIRLMNELRYRRRRCRK